MMRLKAKKGAAQSGRSSRTHERVSRSLLKKLFGGEIAAGEKMPTERVLARDFGVNRATVREALRYLENLELVAVRQGDGAYAKHFLESSNLETAKAMMHAAPERRNEILSAVLEIRRINSPEIAYAAALRRSSAHVRQLEAFAPRSGNLGILERDKGVHRVIGLASGNILHILMTNFCLDFYGEFGDLYFAKEANVRRSEKFHREILKAIRDQNAGVARNVMREVLQYAERAVFEEMARETAGAPRKRPHDAR